MNGIESKVDETLRDSRGSFRKTKVNPFCLENTTMMKADNLISDKVICNGIVSPASAARGCGDVKDGLENRWLFSGLAYGDILVLGASRTLQ